MSEREAILPAPGKEERMDEERKARLLAAIAPESVIDAEDHAARIAEELRRMEENRVRGA